LDELTDQPVEPVEPVPVSPVPAAPAAAGDLSRQIELAVDRRPLDRVRCVRVFADHYRCNWWAPAASIGAATAAAGNNPRDPTADWAFTAMHRVRQSRFLRATHRDGGLVIEHLDPGNGS
jgi:hypothetical protein